MTAIEERRVLILLMELERIELGNDILRSEVFPRRVMILVGGGEQEGLGNLCRRTWTLVGVLGIRVDSFVIPSPVVRRSIQSWLWRNGEHVI